MKIDVARGAEVEKYRGVYRDHPNYRMSSVRMGEATAAIEHWRGKGIVDIGCGRGEMLTVYSDLGLDPVSGTETIPQLCDQDGVSQAMGHALPFYDDSLDYATTWDVIEHLVPGDEYLMWAEMERVSRKAVAFSINNHPSNSLGVELHINVKPYAEWHEIVCTRFPGSEITYHPHLTSPIWVVTF